MKRLIAEMAAATLWAELKEKEDMRLSSLQVTLTKSTIIINIQVITNIRSHVKHVVLELSEYIFVARTLA